MSVKRQGEKVRHRARAQLERGDQPNNAVGKHNPQSTNCGLSVCVAEIAAQVGMPLPFSGPNGSGPRLCSCECNSPAKSILPLVGWEAHITDYFQQKAGGGLLGEEAGFRAKVFHTTYRFARGCRIVGSLGIY